LNSEVAGHITASICGGISNQIKSRIYCIL